MNQISTIARKFCAFHNEGLSKGQRMMIEDGMPAALILTDEQRRAARNLTTALTPPVETVKQRLAPPETEEMKKLAAAAKKAATKKNIHIPKKPKKTAVQARRAVAPKVSSPKNAKTAARTKVQAAQAGVRISGKDIGDATCVAGGITMADLVKRFGIEAHPMRAKIHYAKHKLGYVIEHRDGAYHGTAPKVGG